MFTECEFRTEDISHYYHLRYLNILKYVMVILCLSLADTSQTPYEVSTL